MDTKDIKAEFSGFGPIPSSKTTFAQGIGMGGSFAPVWTKEPIMMASRPSSSQMSFPFWDWSKTQINSDPQNPIYAYDVWFGKPAADSETPSEVHTLSLYTAVANEGITLDGTDIPRLTTYMADGAYGNLGGDGSLSLRNSVGQQIDLNPTQISFVDGSNEGILSAYSVEILGAGKSAILEDNQLTIRDNGNGVDVNTEEIKTFKANGAYAAIGSDGTLSLRNSDLVQLDLDPTQINFLDGTNNGNLSAYSVEITSTGKSAVLESEQLTITSSTGQSYLSTAALQIDDTIQTSISGHADDSSQNFSLSSNGANSKSALTLWDSSNANYFTAIIDSASKVSVRGYSNNEEQQFLVEADSTTGVSKAVLFDSSSTQYLESKVDTDNAKTSIYGYAGNQSQNFNISADASGVDAAKIALYDSGSVNYIEVKEGLDVASVYGYMNNQEHNFVLKAQAGESRLELFNTASECYFEAKATNTESTLYGYSNNQAEYFILKAKAADTQLYLFGDGQYVKIDIPNNGAGVSLSAKWQEIDICVDGVAKKMKVLGTDPY